MESRSRYERCEGVAVWPPPASQTGQGTTGSPTSTTSQLQTNNSGWHKKREKYLGLFGRLWNKAMKTGINLVGISNISNEHAANALHMMYCSISRGVYTL
jgi:hypothetical protein